MKFAIIGTGGQAAFHADALRKIEHAELVGVAGRTAEHTASFAERFTTNVFGSLDEALCLPDLDALIVATPTTTHPDLVCRALDAGKHVFCETPIAHTLEEADRMISASERARRILRIGLIHRFDPENQHLHTLVKDRELGAPRAISTSRLTAPFWVDTNDTSANQHYGNAIHELLAFDLEFLIWTFGMPRVVRANTLSTDDVVTHVQTNLTFSEAICQSEASQCLPDGFPFTLETRIFFDHGTAHLHMAFDATDETSPPKIDYEIQSSKRTVTHPQLEQVQPWVAQLNHFIASVKTSSEVEFASGHDARNALQVCLAIEEAGRTGQTVML